MIDPVANLKQNYVVWICLVLLVVMFSMNFTVIDAVNKIGLVPANTLIAKTYVWNMVTSSFYEISAVKVIVDIGLLIATIKPLSIHSYEQFGLYFSVCLLSCAVATSAYCFIRFFSTRLEEMLMEPVYGFGGVYMILLMFARQQFKNESIDQSIPLLTYQNLPILFVGAQLLMWLIGLGSYALDLPFTVVGILVSWSYLRFFYHYEDNEASPLGDSSDSFAFVSMFPEALRPVTVPLTTAFYNLIVLMGLFPKLEQVEKKPHHHLRHQDTVGDSSSSSSSSKPDLIQERRRAKAMKLLDAKMAELSQEPEGWDVKGGGGDEESGRTDGILGSSSSSSSSAPLSSQSSSRFSELSTLRV